jgi:hypothetical protein
MKNAFILISLLTTVSSFAATTDCSLYVNNPTITHSTYGTNTGANKVNNGVLSILMKNGFQISTNPSKARYSMDTEVRCSQTWTFFGLQDSCITEVTINDSKDEKIVFTDRTNPIAGLNIDFNNITFPSCKDL